MQYKPKPMCDLVSLMLFARSQVRLTDGLTVWSDTSRIGNMGLSQLQRDDRRIDATMVECGAGEPW